MRLLYLLLTLSPLVSGCSLLFDTAQSDGSVPLEIDAAVADAHQPGAECDAPWSVWERRMALRIGSTTETLTSFPILVTLDAGQQLALGLQANGKDLRFSDGQGEELDYEIDTWVGDVAQVWVKVPELRAGQATRIWMYGKNSQVSDSQDSVKVWENEFRGVWHFSEDQLFVDSTGNLDEGSPGSAVDDTLAASGEIGNSVYVGADNAPLLVIPDSPALDTPNGVTLEARVWLSSPSGATARVMLRRKDSVLLAARRQSYLKPDFTVLLNQDRSAVAKGPANLSLGA